MADRTEAIPAHDGGTFAGYVFEPERPNSKAVLLLQEIMGVVTYIEVVAQRLADLGYLVMVPDMYWRLEPGIRFEPPDEQFGDALGFASSFDWALGTADSGSALAHLRRLNEGPAGVLGFCFGGTLAFLTAVSHEPDFAISYYGSGVPDAIDRSDEVTCPLLLHFGNNDPTISGEAIERIRRQVEARHEIEMHVHPGASHAFDNHESNMFYNPEAAKRAWKLTTEFLARQG